MTASPAGPGTPMPSSPDYRPDSWASEVAVLRTDDFGAEVVPLASGLWRLRWTDYVANDWAEDYPVLCLALARMAALSHAVSLDRTFTEGATDFAESAAAWLEGRSQ